MFPSSPFLRLMLMALAEQGLPSVLGFCPALHFQEAASREGCCPAGPRPPHRQVSAQPAPPPSAETQARGGHPHQHTGPHPHWAGPAPPRVLPTHSTAGRTTPSKGRRSSPEPRAHPRGRQPHVSRVGRQQGHPRPGLRSLTLTRQPRGAPLAEKWHRQHPLGVEMGGPGPGDCPGGEGQGKAGGRKRLEPLSKALPG